MAKIGRPSVESPRGKSLAVNVTEHEKAVITLIAKNLGYRTIGAFLRSAITKGAFCSVDGYFTKKEDLKHWKYFLDNWKILEHLNYLEEKKNK